MRRRAYPTNVPPTKESELCAELVSACAPFATAYPETGGWDVLLVMAEGIQCGVQAKLRANLQVLAQTIRIGARSPVGECLSARWRTVHERNASGPGPDIRAVLVPVATPELIDVAAACDVLVLEQHDLGPRPRSRDHITLERQIFGAPRWPTIRRVWVPPFVPDLPAGVPSPRTVSPWKVNAARLCAELRAGFQPTKAELEARVGSLSRWRFWLDRVPGSKPARYAVRDPMKLPDIDFPEVARGLGLPWWCVYEGKWRQPEARDRAPVPFIAG